jgi:hypothetical protein
MNLITPQKGLAARIPALLLGCGYLGCGKNSTTPVVTSSRRSGIGSATGYNESLRQRADMTFWLRFAGGGPVARKAPQDKGWSADLL